MIDRWTLKGFKSISDEILDLKNLTIITGANSVGKSSFLQSILMVAQSVQSSSGIGPPLKLNGELLKLGTMDENIHRVGTESSDDMTVGFRLDLTRDAGENVIREEGLSPDLHLLNFDMESVFQLKPSDPNKGRPQYKSLKICTEFESITYRIGREAALDADLESFKFSAVRFPDGDERPDLDNHYVERGEARENRVQYKNAFRDNDVEGPDQLDFEVIQDPPSRVNITWYQDLLEEQLARRREAAADGLEPQYVDAQITIDMLRGLGFTSLDFSGNYSISLMGGMPAVIQKDLSELAKSFVQFILSEGLDKLFTHLGTKTEQKSQWVGLATPRYLPDRVFTSYDDKELVFDKVLMALLTGLVIHIPSMNTSLTSNKSPLFDQLDCEESELFDDLNRKFLKEAPQFVKNLEQLGKLMADSDQGRYRSWEWVELLANLKNEYLKTNDSAFVVRSRYMSDTSPEISYAIDMVREFFQRDLRYLGPLRVDPRPLYEFSTEESSNVGVKGENTWNVFSRCAGDAVDYWDPEENKPDTRPLEYAVNVWLSYLGLPGIEPRDEGRFGDSVRITDPYVKRELDLTNVGVGVSHPRLQSLLAEFFVGLTKMHIQCIVETHSEHIINRLRTSIVNDEKDTLGSDIGIYFAEKSEGSTKFRPVEINKYGAITDWPEGFFDEANIESQQILSSALRKRRRAKGE